MAERVATIAVAGLSCFRAGSGAGGKIRPRYERSEQMRRVVALRILALVVIVVVAMAIAGIAAYHFGVVNGPNTPMMRGFGFRGHEAGTMWNSDWPGLGLLGMGALVVGGILIVLLLAALLSPDRRRFGSGAPGAAPIAPSAGPAAGDVERLRELSDLHAAGRLTDEEFTAAKRKLLGM